MGLMMTEPDPERAILPSQEYWKQRITRLGANVYLMPDFLNRSRILFRGDPGINGEGDVPGKAEASV
jgi:hypothetical protein